MNVSEIMTRNPETIAPNTPIRKVAEKMKKLDCGFMPVSSNGKILGAITDRDLVLRAMANGKDPDNTAVQEIMSKEICCVSEDEDIEDAADKMCQRQIRRLVVLDNQDHISGVVSLGDIATRCRDQDLESEVIETVSERKH